MRTAAGLLALAVLLTGCLSPRYKLTKGAVTPAVPINAIFAPAPLEASLRALITYKAPGSWKLEALWDEYVVTVLNPGPEPLVVAAGILTDDAGITRTAGVGPWRLEKESKALEKQYRHTGRAFVRYTAPGVIIVGGGAAAVASAGVMTTAAAGAAITTVVLLPAYYLVVWNENSIHKAEVMAEFDRRRLALPLTLQPGEVRTGSLFFPMVASPWSLTLATRQGTVGSVAVLRLDFLAGLHLKPAKPATAGQK